MADSFLIILSIAAMGVVVFGVWWLATAGNRRSVAMEEAATKSGMTFKGNITDDPKKLFVPFRLFSCEVYGNIEHSMVLHEKRMWIFDFEYDIPRDQTVKQTVSVFDGRTAKWPPIIIESRKRERFTVAAGRILTGKMKNWIHQYKEINLPGYQDFSYKYKILSSEPASVVLPELKDVFIKTLIENPGWDFEARGNWVLVYRHGKRIKPGQLNDHAEMTQKIFHAFSQ